LIISFPLPTTMPVGDEQTETIYAMTNLANVAHHRHFAQQDCNQDPLVLSLVQSQSSVLHDEGLDGYLSDLTELSSTESKDESEDDSEGTPHLPQYQLQDLTYASNCYWLCKPNWLPISSRKRKQKGRRVEPSNATEPNHPTSSSSKNRSIRRRQEDFSDPNRKAECFTSTSKPRGQAYGISATGWQGVNFSSTFLGRALISEWENYTILCRLVSFTRVPYSK